MKYIQYYENIDNYSSNESENIEYQEDTIVNIQKNVQDQVFSIKGLIQKRKDQSKTIIDNLNNLEMKISNKILNLESISGFQPDTIQRKIELERFLVDIEFNKITEKSHLADAVIALETQLVELKNQQNWVKL